MEDQSAVTVRFFKNRNLAYWRIFGEIDALRLKYLCSQMALFNYHHHIRYCVFDVSKATIQLNRLVLIEKMKNTISESVELSFPRFNIVFPEQDEQDKGSSTNLITHRVTQLYSAAY